MTWIQTHSGVAFDLLAPHADMVSIDDIAHHLARLARFSGATMADDAYSVAQHSLLCADIVRVWGGDARLQREALLHDAGEAYYGDWTSPVVRALRSLSDDAGSAFDTLRSRTDAAIREALEMEGTEPPLVKRADRVALAIEIKLLLAPGERDHVLEELADTRWTKRDLVPVGATVAGYQFLQRFHELTPDGVAS